MTLRLIVACDHEGCEVEEFVDGRDEFGTWQPVIAGALPGPDRFGHMVIDTGWIGLPKGWALAGPDHSSYDHEQTRFLCPEHRR